MPHPRKIPIEKLTALITKATEGNKGLMLTDYQLLHTMNKGMKRCERISYRTFQRYKAAAMAYGEAELDGRGKFDETYADLYEALVDNEIAQKLALYEKTLTADAKQTRDYKWIMERKFTDLNLRLQTQKQMANYHATEQQMLQDDLQQLKKEMIADDERAQQQALRQKIQAMQAEQPADLPDTNHAHALAEVNPKTEQKNTNNYADLWIRPDGTRRTKEQFLWAVKQRKAQG